MITLFEKKHDCCACGACVNICPKNAISMKSDEYGFLFPIINHDLCIECGLCLKVCAFKKGNKFGEKPITTFAAINKTDEILITSSSGGVFGALASKIFDNNGVVFGCTMNNQMIVEHTSIENSNDIKRLQGSKYVQSDVKFTFRESKKILDTGRKVLYTGTPCQIDALKSYLGKEYDNLLTADLICHGVPNNQLFKDYIRWYELEKGIKIKTYNFRDKTKEGMSTLGRIIYKKDGKNHQKTINYTLDWYYHYFMQGSIYRDSCYVCPYSTSKRTGDFTIGDYWGVEEFHPEIDTNKGVSLLLVNSKKALENLNDLNLYLYESDFEKASRYNKNLLYPTFMSKDRDVILNSYISKGAEGISNYFDNSLGKKKYLLRFKALIPIKMKRKIKKLFSH